MSLLLSIFTEKGCEDILLPAINNADHRIVLAAEKFGLRKNCTLDLEVLDNLWRIKNNGYCTVTKGGEDWLGKPFDGGDVLTVRHGRTSFTVIAMEQSQQIGAYEKFDTRRLNRVTIGKEAQCDICYDGAGILSRQHLTLYFGNGGVTLEDHSTNGVYINGSRVRGSANLTFGDVVSVFGMKLVYLTDILAVNITECKAVVCPRLEQQKLYPVERSVTAPAGEREQQENLFHRSPRKMISLHTEAEEIEGPPQKQVANRKPVWMVIGPSFTMAIPMLLGCGFMVMARSLSGAGGNAFMFVGLVTAITSAIIGVCWAMINLNYSKREEKEAELLRLQKYGEYLMECAERIHRKYEHNRQALLQMYPAAQACCDYWRNTQELWNRNRSHKDFMSYRLGVGEVPFQVPVTIPKKRFSLLDDALANRPEEIKQTYATLQQVPITVDIYKNRIVGLVGKDRANLARLLVTQIAANNCYTDIRVAVLSDGSSGDDWSFIKWLPHSWNDEHTQRYVALQRSELSGVCYELTKILRSRSEERENNNGRQTVLPVQYVVLVESCDILESEPITKYLYDQPDAIGVTTLLMAERYEDLPNTCSYIVEAGDGFRGCYSMSPDGDPPQHIHFDSVSTEAAEQLARKISGIRVVETGAGSDLPDALTFLDMLGANKVTDLNALDNWRKNRTYQTMQALVGVKAGGAPCYLNIHEKFHGPHGLVAGTTGSGKSETLQTYILSLAINYSPLDVGFFIIDFKGGGMANLFDKLPHTLGTISNLSGNQVRRAMVSIKSENMRRQRIFNEYGVNHIDAYTKLVKSGEASQPVPHLFIIIDEFAELKREQPEFMRELISVAQVGRSLGVHLILATQKPSGTVDDNIWSNTKFRLCLRVADKQDSKDMLHKPDAAYLTQAGRCYLQVGNDEIYELFQSGWSGAVYDEGALSDRNNSAVQLENSGKVVMTGGSARARKLTDKKLRWLEQLAVCCADALQLPTEQAQLSRVFALLEEKGLDYPDSVYNRRQMASFMTQYRQQLEMAPSEAARAILSDSQSRGQRLPEEKDKTQLDAVVEYLANIAEYSGMTCGLRLWMPCLPEVLPLDAVKSEQDTPIADHLWNEQPAKNTLRTAIGMVDDPQNQNQFPLVVDFLQGGHLAVCGAVSSGKSVLMQTLAYGLAQTHTPDMLNIYAIDYSSQMLAPFEELPHTGGVVYEGETEKLSRLFLMLKRMLQQRKAQFRGGSFIQYIAAHGNVVPAVLLMLDGYASFREKTENAYESQLLELARDGAGLGIFLCISAGGFGTGEIQAKIGDKLRQVLCLEMDSKYSYGECLRTMQFDVLPESGVRGRGLAQCGESILEYQTALAAPGDDYSRSEQIADRCRQIAALWKGKCAPRIPQIPKAPEWSSFIHMEECRNLLATGRYLPLAYLREDASVYSLDLSKTFCYQITGRGRSGKSVFLRNVACAAKELGGKIMVVDRMDQQTEQRTAALVGGQHINTYQGVFDLWKEIILTINQRHELQKELSQQGMEEEEIFERMSGYEKIFVLIADLNDFAEACIRPKNGIPVMAPQAENIIAKGAQHNVFFFAAVDTQDLTAVSTHGIHRNFVRGKQGVHLGGELNTQKLLSYRNIPFAEQSRSTKPGTGYVPDAEDSMNAAQIVIPMNKAISGDVAQGADT